MEEISRYCEFLSNLSNFSNFSNFSVFSFFSFAFSFSNGSGLPQHLSSSAAILSIKTDNRQLILHLKSNTFRFPYSVLIRTLMSLRKLFLWSFWLIVYFSFKYFYSRLQFFIVLEAVQNTRRGFVFGFQDFYVPVLSVKMQLCFVKLWIYLICLPF